MAADTESSNCDLTKLAALMFLRHDYSILIFDTMAPDPDPPEPYMHGRTVSAIMGPQGTSDGGEGEGCPTYKLGTSAVCIVANYCVMTNCCPEGCFSLSNKR